MLPVLPGLPFPVITSVFNSNTRDIFLTVCHSNITTPCNICLFFSFFLCMSRLYILGSFSPFLLKAIARRSNYNRSAFFWSLAGVKYSLYGLVKYIKCFAKVFDKSPYSHINDTLFLSLFFPLFFFSFSHYS